MYRSFIEKTPNLLKRLKSQTFKDIDMDSQLVSQLRKIKNLKDKALQIVLVYILEKNDGTLETMIKDIVNSFFYSEGKETYILEILKRMGKDIEKLDVDPSDVYVSFEQALGKGTKKVKKT